MAGDPSGSARSGQKSTMGRYMCFQPGQEHPGASATFAARRSPSRERMTIPAFRALNLMKERWRDLEYPWGPGGSIGFELAAGTKIAKPESDLDLVIYAAERITGEMAKALYAQTQDLTAAVDVRVEAPLCGFSLKEYASQNPGKILLRTPDGMMLGIDPWDYRGN